jgi:hypothetical protein
MNHLAENSAPDLPKPETRTLRPYRKIVMEKKEDENSRDRNDFRLVPKRGN